MGRIGERHYKERDGTKEKRKEERKEGRGKREVKENEEFRGVNQEVGEKGDITGKSNTGNMDRWVREVKRKSLLFCNVTEIRRQEVSF